MHLLVKRLSVGRWVYVHIDTFVRHRIDAVETSLVSIKIINMKSETMQSRCFRQNLFLPYALYVLRLNAIKYMDGCVHFIALKIGETARKKHFHSTSVFIVI